MKKIFEKITSDLYVDWSEFPVNKPVTGILISEEENEENS